MRRRVLVLAALAAVLLSSLGVTSVATAPPAVADECYTWTRTLRVGTSGSDVTQLQIRIAGWAAYKDYVAVDGAFGAETEAALKRFQSAYGLSATGVADSSTYNQIYALQDADCTPAHFAWSEFDSCQGSFSGGAVPASTVQSNLLRVMWKLEALRHQLGDRPLLIASGFRSYACNSGASNSQHLYGTAADVVGSGVSFCTIAQQARYAGFSGLIGPGSPDGDHEDHVHLDNRAENNDDGITNGYYWTAPSCGIPTQN